MKLTKFTTLSAVAVASLIFAGQVLAKEPVTRGEAEATVAQATQVFKEASAMHPKNYIPASELKEAAGIVVIPAATSSTVYDPPGSGRVLDGASYGRGVILTKGENGTWTSPLFVDLSGPNLTTGEGDTSVDLVLVIKDQETLKTLTDGKALSLWNASSVAPGEMGRSVSSREAKVLAYERTDDVFTGAMVEGIKLTRSTEADAAFYAGKSGAKSPESAGALESAATQYLSMVFQAR